MSQERNRSRSRRRPRKNKWGADDDATEAKPDAPEWVTELFVQKTPVPTHLQNPIAQRAALAQQALALAPQQVSREMKVPSSVMGHVIGPKGATIASFRAQSGVHVQIVRNDLDVMSNPSAPFGTLQIGPGTADAVDKCVQLVNDKLLDYVARGQAQAAATGMAANIPASLVDNQQRYVPIQATEIDAAAQLAELQDLGPTYPGGIVKELTIPAGLMGGIIGPRQSTLSQIRKAAQVRIEIASQPKLGGQSEGILRVGPAPPEIIAKCEELIQIKSEELLGQRPRNSSSFAMAAGVHTGPYQPYGGGGGQRTGPVPTGHKEMEIEVPKELMGAVIGSQGSGIDRLKTSLTQMGIHGVNVSISANPARDANLPCGKLKVGPAPEADCEAATKIVQERVDEVKSMRDNTKGGKFKGGKEGQYKGVGYKGRDDYGSGGKGGYGDADKGGKGYGGSVYDSYDFNGGMGGAAGGMPMMQMGMGMQQMGQMMPQMGGQMIPQMGMMAPPMQQMQQMPMMPMQQMPMMPMQQMDPNHQQEPLQHPN